MLRNVPGRRRSRLCGLFLNEVLSLNAQEFRLFPFKGSAYGAPQ